MKACAAIDFPSPIKGEGFLEVVGQATGADYGIVMPDWYPAVICLAHFSQNWRPSKASMIVEVLFFT
jgi:hypothetical protein